jgi:hypothetical protein
MDKNIAALLREDVNTVKVQFTVTPYELRRALAAQGPIDPKTQYTYLTYLKVEVGDMVLVTTSNSPVPKVAFVTSIDDGVDIQPNSEIKYKWLVQKVDMTEFDANEARNAVIEETVTEAYKNNLRRSFAQQILSGVDDTKRLQLENLLKPQ